MEMNVRCLCSHAGLKNGFELLSIRSTDFRNRQIKGLGPVGDGGNSNLGGGGGSRWHRLGNRRRRSCDGRRGNSSSQRLRHNVGRSNIGSNGLLDHRNQVLGRRFVKRFYFTRRHGSCRIGSVLSRRMNLGRRRTLGRTRWRRRRGGYGLRNYAWRSPGRRRTRRRSATLLRPMLLDQTFLDLLELRSLLPIKKSHLQEDLHESRVSRRVALGNRSLNLVLGQHFELDRETSR